MSRQRVSDDYVRVLCEWAESPIGDGVSARVMLDLRDARARIAKLEAALTVAEKALRKVETFRAECGDRFAGRGTIVAIVDWLESGYHVDGRPVARRLTGCKGINDTAEALQEMFGHPAWHRFDPGLWPFTEARDALAQLAALRPETEP